MCIKEVLQKWTRGEEDEEGLGWGGGLGGELLKTEQVGGPCGPLPPPKPRGSVRGAHHTTGGRAANLDPRCCCCGGGGVFLDTRTAAAASDSGVFQAPLAVSLLSARTACTD